MMRRLRMMSKRICLDFDGVIHNPYDRTPGYRMGQPVPGALDALRELSKTHSIVIHTSRCQSDADFDHVYDWLRYFGFYQYVDAISLTKPLADVYVDDKGYRFTNWVSDLPRLVG
jgi:5'(3')-deoxyribonucleotidase